MTSDNEFEQASSKAKELKTMLNRWAHEYYVLDTPTVEDSVYDHYYVQLRLLEQDHPEIITPDSPTQRIIGGSVEGIKQAEHSVPMVSLRTETDYTSEPIDSFVTKTKAEIGGNLDYILEPKYDGLGLAIRYSHGRFTLALTRGDGEKGEDVSHNVPAIPSIPLDLGTRNVETIEIRGEVMMRRSTLKTINQIRTAKGKKPYENCRNAAAGSLRQLDPAECRKRDLLFVPYTVVKHNNEADIPIHNQSEVLQYLVSLGFQIDLDLYKVTNDPKVLYEAKLEMEKRRENLDYDIDGVVIKVDELEAQMLLGSTAREPRWAIAHKFEPQTVPTRLLAIDTQVGRTGKMTPVARLDPVRVGGVMVTNVTLHNPYVIRQKGVRVGDMILVRRAGDVIPEITGKIGRREAYVPNYWPPAYCPSCKAPVVRLKGQVAHRCTNEVDCPAKLEAKISHFVARRAMDIRGLGDETVSELASKGLVKSFFDLYTLTGEDLLETSLGPNQSVSLLLAIEASRICPISRFIYALGIPSVGEGTAKRLAASYETLEDLFRTSKEELESIKDIGPDTADSIMAFISDSGGDVFLKKVRDVGIVAESEKKEETERKGPLAGLTFVVTGSFEVDGKKVDREVFIKLIESRGGMVAGKVTKNTSYLIQGKGGGGKAEDAKKLGVPILTQSAMLALAEHQEKQAQL